MAVAILMTFSSVIIIIIIIKFDLRLNVDSVCKPIIIQSFIYYVIACLFRHSFIKNST